MVWRIFHCWFYVDGVLFVCGEMDGGLGKGKQYCTVAVLWFILFGTGIGRGRGRETKEEFQANTCARARTANSIPMNSQFLIVESVTIKFSSLISSVSRCLFVVCASVLWREPVSKCVSVVYAKFDDRLPASPVAMHQCADHITHQAVPNSLLGVTWTSSSCPVYASLRSWCAHICALLYCPLSL